MTRSIAAQDVDPLAPARARSAHLRIVEGAGPGSSRLPRFWDATGLAAHGIRRSRNQVVVSPAQPFAGLVMVRFGSCKSSITGTNGLRQITSYCIAGEVLGAEALCGGQDATVTALEDSEFWLVGRTSLEAAARADASFQRSLLALMSQEIGRDRKAMVMLGTMRSEQRLAAFLLDLADRYGAAGYSLSEYVLRLTREDIGLHLGLSVETVSRLFTRLHHEGLIQVRGRRIRIVDRDALCRVRDT